MAVHHKPTHRAMQSPLTCFAALRVQYQTICSRLGPSRRRLQFLPSKRSLAPVRGGRGVGLRGDGVWDCCSWMWGRACNCLLGGTTAWCFCTTCCFCTTRPPPDTSATTVTLNSTLQDDRIRAHLDSIEQGGSEGSDEDSGQEGDSENVPMSDAVYPWWQEYKRYG